MKVSHSNTVWLGFIDQLYAKYSSSLSSIIYIIYIIYSSSLYKYSSSTFFYKKHVYYTYITYIHYAVPYQTSPPPSPPPASLSCLPITKAHGAIFLSRVRRAIAMYLHIRFNDHTTIPRDNLVLMPVLPPNPPRGALHCILFKHSTQQVATILCSVWKKTAILVPPLCFSSMCINIRIISCTISQPTRCLAQRVSVQRVATLTLDGR